jgi:hypothetical protein
VNDFNDDKLKAFLKANQPLPPDFDPAKAEPSRRPRGLPSRFRRRGSIWTAVGGALAAGVVAFWFTSVNVSGDLVVDIGATSGQEASVEPAGKLFQSMSPSGAESLSVVDDESLPAMDVGEDYLELAGAGGW